MRPGIKITSKNLDLLKSSIEEALPIDWEIKEWVLQADRVQYGFQCWGHNYDCVYFLKYGQDLSKLIDEINCDIALVNLRFQYPEFGIISGSYAEDRINLAHKTLSNNFTYQGLRQCYSAETGQVNIKKAVLLAKKMMSPPSFDLDELTMNDPPWLMSIPLLFKPRRDRIEDLVIIDPPFFIKFTSQEFQIISPNAATAEEKKQKALRLEAEKEAQRVTQLKNKLSRINLVYRGAYADALISSLLTHHNGKYHPLTLFVRKDRAFNFLEIMDWLLWKPKDTQDQICDDLIALFTTASYGEAILLKHEKLRILKDLFLDPALVKKRLLNDVNYLIDNAARAFAHEKVNESQGPYSDLDYSSRLRRLEEYYHQHYVPLIGDYINNIFGYLIELFSTVVYAETQLSLGDLRNIFREFRSDEGLKEFTPPSSIPSNAHMNKLLDTDELIYTFQSLVTQFFRCVASNPTSLFSAVQMNSIERVKACIQKYPTEITQCDGAGDTALELAKSIGNREIIECLEASFSMLGMRPRTGTA